MDNAIEVFYLMYANNIGLLVGYTVLELQRKINIPVIFCEKCGMEVNLTKIKIVVFRKGWKTFYKERFLNIFRSVETVTCSLYLGLIFCSRTTSSKALPTLASKVEKALRFARRMIGKQG